MIKTRYNAIYARQSVEKDRSISIESQIERCKAETIDEHFEVFTDKGYSGKNTDRPEFQRLMAAIRRGEVKQVICYKLDRISRSILDFSTLMEEFEKYDVTFNSCNEKFDTSTPMGRAMLNICIVFAQLERETTQMRVKDAYESRSRKGFYMGGPVPFGYTRVKFTIDGIKTSKYVPNPSEAEIVKLIYELYAQPHTSFGDIVTYLIEKGIKNPRNESGFWDRSRIGEIIKNPIYMQADMDAYMFFKSQGCVIHNNPEDFNGTNGCYLFSDKTKKRKQLCLEGHNIVLAPHTGLVSTDTWIKARKKCLENQQVAKPTKAKNTWLSGKIKCGKCGYALVVKKTKNRNAKYLLCSHSMHTKNCEGVHLMHPEEVENIIFNEMKKKLSEFVSLSKRNREYVNPRISELTARQILIEDEINGLMYQVAKANDQLLKRINERIAKLENELSEINKELYELNTSTNEHAINEITNYLDLWDKLSMDDKKIVCDALIKTIRATETEIDIDWRI